MDFLGGLKDIFGSGGILEGLFGSSGSTNQNTSTSSSALGTDTMSSSSRLQIDTAGVMKTINDILKDPQVGLANIIGQDRMAGLYGSSSAAFSTNDLLDKIAGTIAQLTATKVETANRQTTQSAVQNSASSTSTRKKGILGRLFSDMRLKTDIHRLGTTPGGAPWYSYKMFGLFDEEGVLAQDLLVLQPDAVELHKSGYYLVDYDKVR